jgi:hypothetical protein
MRLRILFPKVNPEAIAVPLNELSRLPPAVDLTRLGDYKS